MRWFYDLLYYFQKRGFEVCERIAERWGIRARVVRTTFIYLTFVTLGFGFALYLFIAFMQIKVKDKSHETLCRKACLANADEE